MAKKRTEKLPPFECNNFAECGNHVQPRRPSPDGNHWCSAPGCQAMKQRERRAAQRNLGVHRVTQEDERLTLLRAALHLPRAKCPRCDLEDGVKGFIHRAAPGSRQICDGLGGQGVAAGRLWIDAIHPDRVSP